MPNKIALVTGANRGIGFETARQLAQQGIHVLLGARTLDKAQQAVDILKKEGLPHLSAIQLDVTSAKDREEVARYIGETFGGLDILVNNAAAIPKEGTLLDAMASQTSEAELEEAFQANLFAVVYLTRNLLPLLRKSEAGRIVNVSSSLGSLTLHDQNVPEVAYTKRFSYNASKAALNMFTIHLAQELAATNIKVNAVHPGWVKTELGTEHAPLEIPEGAKASVEAALLPNSGPSGHFMRQGGDQIPW